MVTKQRIKDIVFGSYDYSYLCMPQWPYCRKTLRKPATFFAKDEILPLVLALVMGLQHGLAMVGGLITPPLLIGAMSPDVNVRRYLINASLIWSGVASFVQVHRFRIPKTNLFIGTGLLSVMGVSFVFLPPVQASVRYLMAEGLTFDEALGKILGTLTLGGVIVFTASFVPPRILKRIFPPVVNGVTILLIGLSLTRAGLSSWGGGAFCADNFRGLAPAPLKNCTFLDVKTNQTVSGPCFAKAVIPFCRDNGEVVLPFGSPEYIGLGFVVFAMLVLLEIFASPFGRSCSVFIALMVGYAVAAMIKVDGKKFITTTRITEAPAVTFLWVERFPLGFYPPLLIPLVVGSLTMIVECIGDVTATEGVSRVEVYGPMHNSRVSGAMRSDGISISIGALATVLPVVTFSQNNGVIGLTQCASRSAGYATAFWLVFLGLFAKVAGFILTIPQCVLGGMTTFLFANVMVTGFKILMSLGTLSRRNMFILACSLGLGIGTKLVPQFVSNALWVVKPTDSSTTQGLNQAVMMILNSGYTLGTLTAMFLNFVLPYEEGEEHIDDDDRSDMSADLPADVDPLKSIEIVKAEAPAQQVMKN